MEWKDELKKKCGIKAISAKTGITYNALEEEETIKYIESLLKEQRENCANKLVDELWISKDGSVYDMVLNAKEPE